MNSKFSIELRKNDEKTGGIDNYRDGGSTIIIRFASPDVSLDHHHEASPEFSHVHEINHNQSLRARRFSKKF